MFLLYLILMLLIYNGVDVKDLKRRIVHENMYVNCSSKCVATSKMYHITRNLIAPEINITFNTPVDECLLKFTAFEFLSNRYQPTVVQFQYTCDKIITMKLFDLDTLFVRCVTPKIYPIQPNVTYTIKGWQPDPEKFPNAYISGRYMIEAVISGISMEELARLYWYYKLDEFIGVPVTFAYRLAFCVGFLFLPQIYMSDIEGGIRLTVPWAYQRETKNLSINVGEPLWINGVRNNGNEAHGMKWKASVENA